MKFSIIHPTARVHPHFEFPWWKTYMQAYQKCARAQDVEYILVVHASRAEEFWQYAGEKLKQARWGKLQIVINQERDCLVDQGNAGRLASTGEIILGSMDDLFFPENWDLKIRSALPDTSQPVAVHCLSGSPYDHERFIPPVFTQALSLLMGPTDPAYDGMFTDDEQTILYRKYGTIVETDIVFEHRHPAFGTASMDEVYASENRRSAYEQGFQVFQRRKAAGFPRISLPGWDELAPAIEPAKQRTMVFCCPGEAHRAEWEIALWNVAATLAGEGWIVRFTFGYTTNVYQTRAGMTRDVLYDAENLGRPDLVLWLDDDNTPTVTAVRFLIAALDQHPEMDVAAGWCWIRTRDAETGEVGWLPSCGNFEPGTLKLLNTKLADLYAHNAAPKAIQWSGLPCVLMRFEALELMGPNGFAPLESADNEFGFTGEDIAFFVRAGSRGLRFCVVPKAKVEHWKCQPIEPDYKIAPGATVTASAEKRLEAIEQDRARKNGPRIETDSNVKAMMEASM